MNRPRYGGTQVLLRGTGGVISAAGDGLEVPAATSGSLPQKGTSPVSPEFTEEQTGTEGPVVHCLQSVLAMENHQNEYSTGVAPIDDFLAADLENDIGVALNTVLVVPIQDGGNPSR